MTSSATVPRGQLLTLLRLRLAMVRSRPLRVLLLVLLGVPVLLCLAGVVLIDQVPPDKAFDIALATPTVYLAFALLAVMAPLAAGGGYELYPPEQLVAYPMRPRTTFLGTLLLAPVNLAWMLNVVTLVVITSFAAGSLTWGTLRSTASVLLFVAFATAFGNALAWFVVGIRQSRRGRIATWLAAGVTVTGVLVLVRLGHAFQLLDASPTKYALANALQGYSGKFGPWVRGLTLLVVGTAVAVRLGVAATAWTLRRPGDHTARDGARPVRRRSPKSSLFWTLVAQDRSSVWRSVPLRRGILVLLVLPGAVAALAGLGWQSLVLMPGLVAAGAALLFGINAFCLDASGATWLSTLPGWDRLAFVAKAWVVAEVALMSVAAALVGGALRAPAPQSWSYVTATFAAAVVAAALVTASSMRSSLRHPYRADLRSSRDTPAPPGVMALQSMRLAVLTTTAGLLFSAFALIQVWWVPLVLAVPFVSWAGLSLVETSRAWARPEVRARVVTTVSGG